MSARPFLLTALVVLSAGALAAQTYALDKCEKSKDPVGYIHASGTVRYTLQKDGRMAEGSLVTLTVDRMSVNGFQSAAIRQLASCKMHRPAADLAVVQLVRFDSTSLSLEPASPASGNEVAIPLTAAEAPPAAPVAINDSLLEERPRWVSCSRAPHTVAPGSSGTNPTSAMEQAAYYRASPLNSGVINAQILVGADGKVDQQKVVLMNSSNPANTSNLLRTLKSCQYAPGRIGGTPVSTIVVAGLVLGYGGYDVVNQAIITILMFN
ncbi:MAG TPA: hypothetical protein VL295_04905, partial [Gemmatimonadales bacterium]|nr:hypothetical protein [Gemmatimonadales bacterium]